MLGGENTGSPGARQKTRQRKKIKLAGFISHKNVPQSREV